MTAADDPIDVEDLALLQADQARWFASGYEIRDDEMMGIRTMLNICSQVLNGGIIFEQNVSGHNELLGLLDWSADPQSPDEELQLVSLGTQIAAKPRYSFGIY